MYSGNADCDISSNNYYFTPWLFEVEISKLFNTQTAYGLFDRYPDIVSSIRYSNIGLLKHWMEFYNEQILPKYKY